MKYLVIAAFVAIIGSLVTALVFMMRGGSDAQDAESSSTGRRPQGQMARALAFRVGFSVLLFVVVLVSYSLGWIQPTGLPLQR